MKRIFTAILCLALLVSALPLCVGAAEPVTRQSVEMFPDGSYCVTTITEEVSEGISLMAAAKTKSGTKSKGYYAADGSLQFTVYVYGTFSYNGSTATATAANSGHSISKPDVWSFVSDSAMKSGATATGISRLYSEASGIVTYTVSLTCSPDGTLS